MAPARAASRYEEAPFFWVLQRYFWPFWLFKDASRGDCLTRAAAYRHNRSMRVYLPAYVIRWLCISALAYAAAAAFESLTIAAAGTPPGPVQLYWLLAAACNVLFAVGLCMLLVTGYVYVYLGRHER